MARILKNQTGSAVPIPDVGETVPASGTLEIRPPEFLKYATSTDIDPLLVTPAPTLILEHNGDDLSEFDAKCLIHEITDYAIVEKNIPIVTEIARQLKRIRFLGSIFQITKPTNDRVDVGLLLSGSAEGKEATYQFFNNGANIEGKWLDHEGSNIPCDDTPGIVSANGKIRAITFSNTNNNVDLDLQVFKNGTAPDDLLYTWEIRDCRIAFITDIDLQSQLFGIGDTVRMFAKKVTGGPGGNKPSKAVVKLTLINTDEILAEGCEPTDNPPITQI